MSRFKPILTLFLALFSFSGLLAQAPGSRSVPLPDDDAAHASKPSANTPMPKSEAATKQVIETPLQATEDDWQTAWRESAKISGVKVDFRIIPSLKNVIVKRGPVPVSLSQLSETDPVEGEQAIMQFRFTDPAGTPLSGLNVAAWMDQNLNSKLADEGSCHAKIQSFLQMQFAARPEVDLNTYYVLALTKEPGILVIDPRVGFSSSRLYAAVDLPATGEDWALTGDHDRLFVSMPSLNRVAVVDTLTFRVQTTIDAGASPHRVLLQPDGKYLWIGNDGGADFAGGVTVVDANTLKVVAHIATGAGHHEIAFDQARHVYVTNQEAATVSVLSIEKLARIRDVSVGRSPVSLAYSSQSKAIYVSSESEGRISVISAESHNLNGNIPAKPGLSMVRITPDGRWGFAANASDNTVLLFDVSSNKVRQHYDVGRSPDQLAFTTAYVYVRSRGSEDVTLIPLSDVGKSDGTAHFVAGQFVANAADRRIYFYQEGMAAPMFSMEGYGKTPKSTMVLDRSIHETSPGIYSIGVKLPKAAGYDVPVFVDSPSISHCFNVAVEPNPLLKKKPEVAVALHPMNNDLQVRPGEPIQVSFRLIDAANQNPRDGLQDVEITVLLAEGLRQQHLQAESVGDGVYRFTFTPAREGVYYAMVHIPSLKVKANQLPYIMVRALSQPENSKLNLPAAQQKQQSGQR
jgi:YVTN family beta-propeller protein